MSSKTNVVAQGADMLQTAKNGQEPLVEDVSEFGLRVAP
jgi:hypothetical protein